MNDFEPLHRLRRCRHGCFLYNRHDVIVGRSLDQYGEYSEDELVLLGSYLRPQDVVVDVGANLGVHTVFFARRVGRQGRVLAFEPQRLIFQLLCGNVVLNHLTNVNCMPAGAGAIAGHARLQYLDYGQESNFGGVSLQSEGDGEQVEIRRLDEFALRTCRLIKIDVEGMERDVLLGAAETIRQFRPVLYVENDRHEKSRDLIETLRSMSYRMYWHRAPYFNPHNYLGATENIFPNVYAINMLCLPAESDIEPPLLEEVP